MNPMIIIVQISTLLLCLGSYREGEMKIQMENAQSNENICPTQLLWKQIYNFV